MDDRELIQRIASGEETAFRQLVELHSPSVLNVCYRVLRNREDAEEVAQEVFLQAFRRAGSFRGESKLSTWLYRVAVNLSLNLRRRRKWDRYFNLLTPSERGVEEAASQIEASTDARPDFEFETRERSRLLQEALDRLPEKQRLAIILHKSEGLSHKEISEILEVSVSSVESLIHRAKNNLQKRLTPMLGKM